MNILRKEFSLLNAKLSTNEKENEALVYRLTTLTITMQELDERFKAKEVEFDYLQELNEAIVADNEQLKRINEELIRQFESKQATPGVSDKNTEESIKNFAEQMTKELANKFSIPDQEELKMFTSSYLNKFHSNISTNKGDTNGTDGEELKTNQDLNDELVNEREKNVKLQSDYQKLKEEMEKIGNRRSPSKDENGLAKRSTNLEQNLDQISNMYQQIASQKQSRNDNQVKFIFFIITIYKRLLRKK